MKIRAHSRYILLMNCMGRTFLKKNLRVALFVVICLSYNISLGENKFKAFDKYSGVRENLLGRVM